MLRWLTGGCGTVAALLAALLFILVVVIIAIIIVTTQIYLAAIYTWFFSDDDETTIPLSIHGMPTTGTITATFHDPDYLDRFGMEHQGIDIANGRGTPIYNTSNAARVVNGGWDASGYGLFLKLQDIESGYFILYAHMDSVSSEIMTAYANGTIGSLVLEHGDQIGRMDSSGMSTGDHLHYEIRDPDNNPVDPEGSEGCCS